VVKPNPEVERHTEEVIPPVEYEPKQEVDHEGGIFDAILEAEAVLRSEHRTEFTYEEWLHLVNNLQVHGK
jgi:hypothetical protein